MRVLLNNPVILTSVNSKYTVIIKYHSVHDITGHKKHSFNEQIFCHVMFSCSIMYNNNNVLHTCYIISALVVYRYLCVSIFVCIDICVQYNSKTE